MPREMFGPGDELGRRPALEPSASPLPPDFPAGPRGAEKTALLAAVLVLLLCLCSASAAAAGGDRVALVVANSHYRTLDPVPNAVEDARAVAGALRDLGFAVVELFDGTRGQMSAGVQRFAKRLSPDAIAVFYYAGHGVQFQGRNFLLPVSADLQDDFAVLTEGVLVDSVLAAMERSGAALKLLVLDASRADRFVEASESLEPGFAEMTAASAGTIIVHAAAPGRVVAGDGATDGAFAAALTALLSEPVVEINRLLEELPARVEAATDGRQSPWISAAARTGALFLRAPPPRHEITAVSTGPAVAEGAGAESEPDEAPMDATGEAPEDRPGQAPEEIPEDAAGAETSAMAEDRPSGGADTAAVDSGTTAPADDEDAGPAATTQSSGRYATLRAIEAALSDDDKRRVQEALARQGLYDGNIDGIFGAGTRRAIRAYQKATGAPRTGWLSAGQLHRLLLTGRRAAQREAEQPNVNQIGTSLPDPAPPAAQERRRLR